MSQKNPKKPTAGRAESVALTRPAVAARGRGGRGISQKISQTFWSILPKSVLHLAGSGAKSINIF